MSRLYIREPQHPRPVVPVLTVLGINDADGFDDYHPPSPSVQVPKPPRRPKSSKTTSLRAALADRDGPRCWMCGDELLLRRDQCGHPLYATLDHVVPRAHGGSSEIENLRLACRSCNNRRGCQPAHDPLPVSR